jgi:hypothetical protein
VLVRTGKFTPDALSRAAVSPDAIVDSIADVPGILGSPSVGRPSDDVGVSSGRPGR